MAIKDTSKPKAAKKKKKPWEIDFHIGGIPPLKIALSIKHLTLMLKSGLSLGDAIDVLARQTVEPRLKEVYERINDRIQNGMTLADSMAEEKKVFSEIIVAIVRTGEQGGTLETNLLFLADYLKRGNTLKNKIQGALIYPGVIFGLAILEILGVIYFVLPQLETVFVAFGELPVFTKAILDGSRFVRENTVWFIVGFIVAGVLINIYLSTKAGKRFKDTLAIKAPVLSKLNVGNTLATISRTINILLSSGIPLVAALEISVNAAENGLYKEKLIKVHEQVQAGNTLASTMNQYPGFFPPTFTQLVEVGEDTGSLEDNFMFLYEYYAEEVEEIAQNFTTLIEPILLVVIGGLIGLLALIIIGPIYQFTGNINGL